jgi:hypothetical protein
MRYLFDTDSVSFALRGQSNVGPVSRNTTIRRFDQRCARVRATRKHLETPVVRRMRVTGDCSAFDPPDRDRLLFESQYLPLDTAPCRRPTDRGRAIPPTQVGIFKSRTTMVASRAHRNVPVGGGQHVGAQRRCPPAKVELGKLYDTSSRMDARHLLLPTDRPRFAFALTSPRHFRIGGPA